MFDTYNTYPTVFTCVVTIYYVCSNNMYTPIQNHVFQSNVT